jgi:hypothetical protein
MHVKRGVSLVTVLTVIFVTYKLTGGIDWSWWWVLAPLWIPFGAAVLVVLLVLLLVDPDD